MYLLVMMVWTILSLVKDGNLWNTSTNQKKNNFMAPILLVEANWFSEICYTGPRYKVKVDPVTGKVVPVYPDGYVYDPPFVTESSDDEGSFRRTGSDDTENAMVMDSPLQDVPSSGQSSGVTVEESNGGGGLFRRTLRNNRIWRDFDEDSEMDAMVVSENASGRSLHHDIIDGLEEGEFYVKPCICENMRWTFVPGAGLNQQAQNSTFEEPEKVTHEHNRKKGEVYYANPTDSPNSFGLGLKNELAHVPDNKEDGDLYLCREEALYCGVLYDAEGISETIVKCYDQNMKNIIARNAWPLIVLWYCGLAVICCCTVHGRTAGDFAVSKLTYAFNRLFSCCRNDGDFNDRMIDRMIHDDDRERRRRNGYRQDEDDEGRPWFFSRQRLLFERALMQQVQWIWRHQEYLRDMNLREQGLPPPRIKLRVKRFRMETSTSNSNEGGFSNTPALPPTNISTQDTMKGNVVDTSKHRQQLLSALPSIESSNTSNSKTHSSEEPRGDSTTATSVADKSTSEGSLVSSSSAENALANEETPFCGLCADEKITNDEEFATLVLRAQNEQDEASAEHMEASDVNSLDGPTCAICFCEFEEGDRIGDLSCKHEFHIDCLKGWVQRKNACPLCNVRIGKPERPPPPPQEDETDIHTDASTSIGEDDQNWMQRFNDWLHGPEQNHSNSSGAGEISTGYRIGMIGVASSAADIAEARERVSRRHAPNN